MLHIVTTYGPLLALAGTLGTFVFGAFKYFHERREAHYWKEFEVFHKLVRELVEPSAPGQALYLDRQCAVVYELRKYKRYYPYTLRMLKGLREAWSKIGNFERLIEEIDSAIAFLESKVPPSRRGS